MNYDGSYGFTSCRQRSTLYLARQFGYGISNHFIGIKTSVFHAYFWAKISYSRGNINLADVMYIFAVTMSMIKNTFKWIEKAASAQKCDLYSAFNFQHPPSSPHHLRRGAAPL